jgi:lipoprotein NlpD
MSTAKSKTLFLSPCCPASAERAVTPITAAAGVRWTVSLLMVAAVSLLAGCATPRPAPVVDRLPQGSTPKPQPKPAPAARVVQPVDQPRPESYTVKAGDTLYAIALEFGLDYRELAGWNNIDPSRIRVGQQLRLSPPKGAVATPLRAPGGAVESQPLDGSGKATAGGARTEPRGVRVPYSDQAYTQMSGVKPEPAVAAKPEPQPQPESKPAVAVSDDVEWIWPVSGKVVTPFNETSSKGIGIAGKAGQPVVAAGPGRVIFSGTGIRGLGKLIVIKHNEKFLSVYAHNRELLVKEGQTVTRGQRIAEMGDTDTDQVKLHFEIRRLGKPIDPATLLPPA